MRAAFFLLERAASSDATLLIQGETGTGKDAAAESVHLASKRKNGPFIVIDCGAIPPNLMESELFGHERGAFTGAIASRAGAFEAASSGTIFLDELGELPLDLQPKLLRVLEQRTVQRLGSTERRATDVRVIAATNRDLRAAVNRGVFREDLYYRLAVIRVHMPSLRERPEDIPFLTHAILAALHAEAAAVAKLITDDFLGRLKRAAWPGNVRELRNYLEQSLILLEPAPLCEGTTVPEGFTRDFDATPSYEVARRRAIDEFEQQYLRWLLLRHGDNVSQAARVAGMNRRYLYRLRERHGL
jgi:transcriptional regulator with PAS, ATPase and Fis domain